MSNETESLSVYRVDDEGECVWAIAASPEEARAISREYLRDSEHPEDYEGCDEGITVLPMGESITIINEDDGAKETLTVAEWIERNGAGFLATTCV